MAGRDERSTGAEHDHLLGAVYDAQRPQEVAELYDRWAATYDGDMASVGYRHPTICLALLARYVPRGAEPILDAGAGTGVAGEWLSIIGYPRIEALDISMGMLEVARARRVYSRLHVATLGNALPFADNCFAGILSAGVFTTGHVGTEGLDELVRICRPGGAIVLTVKTTLWNSGFVRHIDALIGDGLVELAEQTAPYASMPGGDTSVPSLAAVLRVLR